MTDKISLPICATAAGFAIKLYLFFSVINKIGKMIKSFKGKDTQRLFERKRVLKWRSIEKVARRKLRELDQIKSLEELGRIPSNRLHKLVADRKGQWSLSINKQYRVCFI